MGAIMPNAMALVGEYSPRRARVTVMMVVSNGFTAGAALGGFVAAWMLPLWGWRSVFYFGAVVPLVIALIMLLVLPESIQFLTLQGKKLKEAGKWLQRVNPAAPAGPGVRYVVPEEPKRGGLPFVSLFHDGRAVGTVLLWVLNFMNLLNIYLLQGWLTTFIADTGIQAETAALIASMVQVGGTVGAFTLGWFVHKKGFAPVLATCSLVACLNIAVIGQPWMTAAMLFAVVFIAGVCVVGGQAAINSLSATYYPTELRATGIGAGLGVGRMGAIIGPTLVSVCLNLGWTASEIFLAAAAPPLISFLVMISWNRLAKPAPPAATGRAVVAH
jgi:AAHS family 4-hydroxybenzoate transporter-like MFS transporter